jgi:hypothetical protein
VDECGTNTRTNEQALEREEAVTDDHHRAHNNYRSSGFRAVVRRSVMGEMRSVVGSLFNRGADIASVWFVR